MFKNVLVLGSALLLPLSAHAGYEINMYCGQSVRDFFVPLVQNRLIQSTPHSVGASSVNAFRPKLFAGLTAFGLPVKEVFGYSDDPLLFTTVGEQPEHVYGVIVREGIGNVEATLRSVRAFGARVVRADANNTVIMCKGE